MDSDRNESAVRRRRKLTKPVREATPEPNFGAIARRKRLNGEQFENSIAITSPAPTASTEDVVQAISLQIRPPVSSLSAHQSKILRRRDKAFAEAATRSHSQPRQAERLSSPEAYDLLRKVKRSLSSPRQKEDSSENEFMIADNGKTAQLRHLSPESAPLEKQRTIAVSPPRSATQITGDPVVATADENLSRLELNLRRFEEERKRLEAEKHIFEREKRERKLRPRQLLDNEERKKLLLAYRRLGDRVQSPNDIEERRRLVHSIRLNHNEIPTTQLHSQRIRTSRSGYDESSTQFSSSDADIEDVNRQLKPIRRHARAISGTRDQLPPQRDEQMSPGRNNSISPIRPQRQSKTPEKSNGLVPKSSELTANDRKTVVMPGEYLSATERKLSGTQSTEIDSEMEVSLRKRSLRKESLRRAEMKRRQSVEGRTKDQTVPSPKETEDRVDKGSKNEVAQISKKQTAEKSVGVAVIRPPNLREKVLSIFGYRKPRLEQATKESKEKSKTKDTAAPSEQEQPEASCTVRIFSIYFLRLFCKDIRQVWTLLKRDYPKEWQEIRRLCRKCFAHIIVLILLCGFGGLMFRYTEGTSENIYKCEVRKVKRDFIDNLWTVSHSMREDDWKSLARQKLRNFEEEVHKIQIMGIRYYPGQKSWNFVNCILYCWTVITTIGYGHITPKTSLGQTLTIVYAIIGIPMFLILLADFGKLFTRGMKFLWAYVRRLYYTGTCRQIRKQQQVRDAMSGFNTVYNMATRRPSYFFGLGNGTDKVEADVESQAAASEGAEGGKSLGAASRPDTPTSPYPETFEVDDEFNLPVSVATTLLVAYILIGAFVYTLWEDWSYFEAFYFVFISMSTIGFGDFVPNHPIFMMCSIIYLIFGLALTSMFINVVQIKLSDTFKQASAKIGATIGLGVPSEMGDEKTKTPSDIVSVHGSRLDKITENESATRLSATSASATTPTTAPLTSILRPSRPISPPQQATNKAPVVDEEDCEASDVEPEAPPLLPRRQFAKNQTETKKKRFFK